MSEMSNDYQSVSIYLKDEVIYLCPMGKTTVSVGLRVFNGDIISLPFDTPPREMVDSIKNALESSSSLVAGSDFRFTKLHSDILLKKSGYRSLKSFYGNIKLVNLLYFKVKSTFEFKPQRQFAKGSFRVIEEQIVNLAGDADDASIVMALKEALLVSE